MTTTIGVEGTYYVDEHYTFNDVIVDLGSASGGGEKITLQSHDTSSGMLIINSTATFNSYAPDVYANLNGYTIVNNGHLDIANGSTLFLGSNVSNVAVINTGSVSIANGGELVIDSSFDLDGRRFAPAGTGTIGLNYGEMKDGTFAPGGIDFITEGGLMDNVTYQGDLNVGRQSVLIRGGLRVETANGAGPGTINLTGLDAAILFNDDETLNNVVINLNAAGALATAHNNAVFSGGALTLGTGVTVNSNVAMGGDYDELNGGGTMVNDGLINVAAGSTIAVQSGLFIEHGRVSIASNGVLLVSDDFDLNGTSFAPEGTGTLDAGSAGTIANGTIVPGGIDFASGGGVLDNVTYRGNLNIANNRTVLNIAGGLRVESASCSGPGTINLIGYNDFLVVDDNETLNNVVINIGPPAGGANAFNAAVANQSLTFGSAATINSDAVHGDDDLEGSTIVNDGQINVAAGSNLDIASFAFTNSGMISVASGGVLTISDGLDNAGTIEVSSGGTLDLTGTITGTGKLILDPGAITEVDGVKVNAVAASPKSATRLVSLPGFSTMSFISPTGAAGDSGLKEKVSGGLQNHALAGEVLLARGFKPSHGAPSVSIDESHGFGNGAGVFAEPISSPGFAVNGGVGHAFRADIAAIHTG